MWLFTGIRIVSKLMYFLNFMRIIKEAYLIKRIRSNNLQPYSH